jgi:hypothetical protein
MKKLSKWNQYHSFCGESQVYDSFNFALFQGHFSSANISQTAGPLMLLPAAGVSCPFIGYPYVQKIEFANRSYVAAVTANPMGESNPLGMRTWTVNMQANATTGYCKTRTGTVTETITKNGSETTSTIEEPGSECGPGTSLYGYWTWPTANETCFVCDLHPFSAGSYTLVADDVWNQTVYAYFQVSSPAEIARS